MKFKINQVVYDNKNKELVKITNGIELGKQGLLPTEGIVIRFLGFNIDNKPILGITYRFINSDNLSVSTASDEFEKALSALIPHNPDKTEHFYFRGRV